MSRHAIILAGLVVAATSLLTPAMGALLTNGSFENHTGFKPDDWDHTGNLEISDMQGQTDGSFAVAFSALNLPSTGVLSQTFATTVGQTYLLTFDFGKYSVNQPDETARLEVDVFDGVGFGGTNLLDELVTDNTPTVGVSSNSPDVYDPYEFSFTALSLSTTLRFGDVSDPQSVGGGFDAMLDNVVVNPVPEPATFAVLGLAGLAIIRRRRR